MAKNPAFLILPKNQLENGKIIPCSLKNFSKSKLKLNDEAELKIGDCVYLHNNITLKKNPLSQKFINENAFIVRILEMFEDKKGKSTSNTIKIQWFWRSNEVNLANSTKKPNSMEIYLDVSFELGSEVDIASIISPCYVKIDVVEPDKIEGYNFFSCMCYNGKDLLQLKLIDIEIVEDDDSSI